MNNITIDVETLERGQSPKVSGSKIGYTLGQVRLKLSCEHIHIACHNVVLSS